MKRKDVEQDEYIFACEHIERGERKLVHIFGRDVALFHLDDGTYSAIDGKCYHKGGPLIEGDIEDMDDRQCIKCPSHGYYFDVITGEGLFVNSGQVKCSKGEKQRVHNLEVRDDGIWVQEIDAALEYESDWFADDTTEIRKTRKRKMYY